MKVRANPQRDVRGITVNVWLVFLLLLCLSGVFSGLTLSTTTTTHYPYLSIVNALHLYSAFLVLLTTQGALKSQSNFLFNFKIDKEDFGKAENCFEKRFEILQCTTTNRIKTPACLHSLEGRGVIYIGRIKVELCQC